jgi:hypothetical protein
MDEVSTTSKKLHDGRGDSHVSSMLKLLSKSNKNELRELYKYKNGFSKLSGDSLEISSSSDYSDESNTESEEEDGSVSDATSNSRGKQSSNNGKRGRSVEGTVTESHADKRMDINKKDPTTASAGIFSHVQPAAAPYPDVPSGFDKPPPANPNLITTNNKSYKQVLKHRVNAPVLATYHTF